MAGKCNFIRCCLLLSLLIICAQSGTPKSRKFIPLTQLTNYPREGVRKFNRASSTLPHSIRNFKPLSSGLKSTPPPFIPLSQTNLHSQPFPHQNEKEGGASSHRDQHIPNYRIPISRLEKLFSSVNISNTSEEQLDPELTKNSRSDTGSTRRKNINRSNIARSDGKVHFPSLLSIPNPDVFFKQPLNFHSPNGLQTITHSPSRPNDLSPFPSMSRLPTGNPFQSDSYLGSYLGSKASPPYSLQSGFSSFPTLSSSNRAHTISNFDPKSFRPYNLQSFPTFDQQKLQYSWKSFPSFDSKIPSNELQSYPNFQPKIPISQYKPSNSMDIIRPEYLPLHSFDSSMLSPKLHSHRNFDPKIPHPFHQHLPSGVEPRNPLGHYVGEHFAIYRYPDSSPSTVRSSERPSDLHHPIPRSYTPTPLRTYTHEPPPPAHTRSISYRDPSQTPVYVPRTKYSVFPDPYPISMQHTHSNHAMNTIYRPAIHKREVDPNAGLSSPRFNTPPPLHHNERESKISKPEEFSPTHSVTFSDSGAIVFPGQAIEKPEPPVITIKEDIRSPGSESMIDFPDHPVREAHQPEFNLSLATGNGACNLQNGQAMHSGQCSLLLAKSSCLENHWLILTKKGAAVCAHRKCPWGRIYYEGKCVDPADESVCGPGQMLYVQLTGEAECDCESKHFYDPKTGVCYAEHERGFCPDSFYIELNDEDKVECVPNPCHQEGFVKLDGRCYKKAFDGVCPSSQILYHHKDGMAECMHIVPHSIFGVGIQTSCPSGSKRSFLRTCRSVFRMPTQRTFPKQRGACPSSFTGGSRNSCRRTVGLFG